MATLKEMRDAANAWVTQEKADIASGKKKIPLNSKEKQMTDKNKPLKTALVREVEPGRNRKDEALKGGSAGPTSLGSKMKRLQTAAETGEAQAFVGKMKSGVEARTIEHTLQSREHPQTKAPIGQGRKDLGRAVVNQIKRGGPIEDLSGGGTLMKLAKTRALAGRSIAGPDPVVSKQSMSASLKAKFGGGKGGVSGHIPDFPSEQDLHTGNAEGDLRLIPGMKRRLEPGDL